MKSIPTPPAADDEGRVETGERPHPKKSTQGPATGSSDVRQLIEDAIRRRRTLGVTYHYYSRCVEPCWLAVDRDGNDTLIAWQVSGGSDDGSGIGWKQFLVSELAGVRLLIDNFSD